MTRPTRTLPRLRALLAATALCATGLAAQAAVLILGAPRQSNGLADVQAKLSDTGLLGGVVDVFNVAGDTPTLALLSAYDSVLVFSDARYASGTLLGNVLADYVDAGGGVVEAAFSNYSGPLGGLAGRFVTQNYDVYTTAFGLPPWGARGATTLAASPLLDGVDSFSGGASAYCNRVNLKAGTTLVASWSNGEELLAYRLDHNAPVVGLNMYPVSGDVRSDFWDTSTDGARLMANALVFAGRLNRVPEPDSLALLGIATVAAGIALRRRKA